MSDQSGYRPEEPPGGDAWPPAAPPYGAPQGPAAGQSYGVPYGYGAPPPNDSRDTTVLVLGILGLVACQLLSPVAWYMGKQRIDEVRARGLPEPGSLRIGYILGIVGSVLVLLGIALVVLFVVFALVIGSTSS